MTTPARLTDEELDQLEELALAATPGPWHVRLLDDEDAMGLVAVSTVPDTGLGERWPHFDHHEIVAATLVQQPRYVDTADERWDENARFHRRRPPERTPPHRRNQTPTHTARRVSPEDDRRAISPHDPQELTITRRPLPVQGLGEAVIDGGAD
ncbi:hypothetical protein [Streptomyces lunaelactis]|uniref:hypothetical protein n=1 Tax=Streptomyces lunaelactis TaxID=1535768 RepID=UPI001FEA8FA7